MVQQLDLSLNYARLFCPDLVEQNITKSNLDCVIQAARGQNMIDLFLKLKIQGHTLVGDIFQSYSVIQPEESGTYLCASIIAAEEGSPSQSGVLNGVETIIDLETFDNGDLNMIGDGAYVQITEPKDYPLPQLKGFSVGPGSAVEVHIRPALFSITQAALNFDYLERKCAEPSVDKGLEDLDGMDNDYDYSISNCLVSAAVTVMDDDNK